MKTPRRSITRRVRWDHTGPRACTAHSLFIWQHSSKGLLTDLGRAVRHADRGVNLLHLMKLTTAWALASQLLEALQQPRGLCAGHRACKGYRYSMAIWSWNQVQAASSWQVLEQLARACTVEGQDLLLRAGCALSAAGRGTSCRPC